MSFPVLCMDCKQVVHEEGEISGSTTLCDPCLEWRYEKEEVPPLEEPE